MPGKQLDTVLRCLILALILLATLLLGVGERSAILPLIALIVAALSVYLTDMTRRFFFTQRMANWAALLAVAGSGLHACYVDRHGLMLVVADLQSYLQFVLLFQPKTSRVYWQLALLSLGQLAIGSTLVPGPMFGAILLIYLLVGIATFALLLLRSESKRFEHRPARLLRQTSAAPETGTVLAGSTPVVWGNAATLDPRALARGLCAQAALVAAATLAVTATLFLLLPRWNVNNRQEVNLGSVRAVGFSKKVTLGELGEVVQSPEVVMRIQFFHGRGSKPFKLIGEPLFRGTVVTRYDGGAWTQSIPSYGFAAPSNEVKTPYVRQHITAEPLDASELFCVFPVFTLQKDSRLKVDSRGDQLLRLDDLRGTQVDFEIATTGIQDDKQRRFVPCNRPLRADDVEDLLQMPQDRNINQDRFAGLRSIAATVLRDQQIQPTARVTAATALSNHLRRSGQYFYSLDSQKRDPRLDPLEDFMTLHRLGHCEYFAGALTMMLRSQGIPARMVIGFKGGEWNTLGMYYQVQQLHAHAWVEVYLDEDHIPEGALTEDDSPRSAWLVLDPTEGTQDGGGDQEDSGPFARLRQYFDYGQVLWTNYVVGLSAKRQRQTIYDPIRGVAQATVENLVSTKVWQARIKRLSSSRVGMFWEWYRRHWFSWRGGLVAIGFCIAAVTLVGGARGAVRAIRRLGRSNADGALPVLEMYRRLETALRARGIERRPAQTAYEFAVAAGGNLAENLEDRRVAHLPRRIVEAFYRVRFGRRTLDNQEADAVEHALVELELALGRTR